MIISEFLKIFKGCQHKRVSVNSKGAYCPDCGKFVVIKWYIVRCACCGIKRVAYVDFNDNIKPEDRFCPNCGTAEVITEEHDKINFVDINFAVHRKEICENNIITENRTQIWTDNDDSNPQLMIEQRKY